MNRDTKKISSEKHTASHQKQPTSKDGEEDDCNTYKLDKKESPYRSSSSMSNSVQEKRNPNNVVNKLKSAFHRLVLEPPMTFFEKRREFRNQKRRSEQIDKKLKQEDGKKYPVLIFGTEQSGKSTIIKQLRMMYANGFDEEEKKQIAKNIKQNVATAILALLAAMAKVTPPIELEKSENQKTMDYIKAYASKPDFSCPREFLEHVETLWKDKGIQNACDRENEFHLADYAKYFFNRLNTIKSTDYMPTDQDILFCHTTHTNGVFDIHFDYDMAPVQRSIYSKANIEINTNLCHFHISEIIDQTCKRHLWKYFYFSVLIFIASCNSYDIVYSDDPTKNQLQESIRLFKLFVENKRESYIPIILLLNKQDLLSEKVLAGRSKLEDYFPAYASYQTWRDEYFEAHDPQEVIRVKSFILDKFVENIDEKACRRTFFHFICATNAESIRKVFYDCSYQIYCSYTCTWHIQ